jgi:hypothetical protein
MNRTDFSQPLSAGLVEQTAPPLTAVPVTPDPDGFPCPDALRSELMVDVIHDGNHVPPAFLRDADGKRFPGAANLPARHRLERDWGAELVAGRLAAALALPHFYRVNLARVLVDFGRFPGITPPSADYLQRFAINHPFSDWLGHAQKTAVLEECYDQISAAMDAAIRGKRLKIAIHTYDERNASRTRRPAVSILTRPRGLHFDHQIPVGLFDPLFPSDLALFTADRLLRSRLALTLEEHALHVEDNYPYSLPEGSVEVRAQVWYFFLHLQQAFDEAHPTNVRNSAQAMVWRMLFDTNLRSAESEALRSYLHMFRHPPRAEMERFSAARHEYERIANFMQANHAAVVEGYKTSLARPSTILVEVRKDLVWDFAAMQPRVEQATFIARAIAEAVQTYLVVDRPARKAAEGRVGDRFR